MAGQSRARHNTSCEVRLRRVGFTKKRRTSFVNDNNDEVDGALGMTSDAVKSRNYDVQAYFLSRALFGKQFHPGMGLVRSMWGKRKRMNREKQGSENEMVLDLLDV